MSILIDDRGHQPLLLPYFKPYAVEAESAIMDASDIFFVGNGPAGNCTVGIERKKLSDLSSSIRSERLVGFQLEGLWDYDFPMIVFEGIWRAGKHGELEVLKGNSFATHYVGQRPVLYRELSNFLVSMELTCGITVVHTSSAEETAAWAVGLYHWFRKEWDEHKAHLGIYAPVPEHPNFQGGHKLRLVKRPKPTLVTKMAAQIPGLDQRAWKVGEFFSTPLEMASADEKTWQEIDGIGKKGAKTIVEALQNG